MKKKVKMKLFTDYICPWCYLGDAVVNSLRDRYDLEIEHVGFELHPDTAPTGNDLIKQFPGSNEMFENLRVRGEKYGLSFAHLTLLPNSQKALLVGEHAKEIGKGDVFVHEMWNAYFRDGEDIGNHQVIIDTAAKVGISEKEVNLAIENSEYMQRLNQNMEAGKRYGINSVPTFIVEDQFMIIGAQNEDVFINVIEQLEPAAEDAAPTCEDGACRIQ